MFGCTESRHREPSSRQIELEALLPGYVSRLTRKGTSVRKLFKEYHAEYPEDYQLSSFKRAVRQYKFHIKVVGHVEHYAADQMYIDFAGDRREVVDEMTGETKKAEVFVAILPFSHYTYCEAVWSQHKEDLIKGCENAMHYFEGVPAAIVPDNLKAAVTRSDRNEPVINDDFAAFAEHYGCAVYPAMPSQGQGPGGKCRETSLSFRLPGHRGDDVRQSGRTQYRHPYFPARFQ